MAERTIRSGHQGTSWTPGGRREDRYAVIDGRIWNNSCEIEVVHHCNLACRSCSHLSPLMHRELVEPKDMQHDLTLLSHHYRAASVRLVGGEPLLHPRLLDLVEAVRASGIAPRVHVFTNGTRLPRMGDEFWAAVDEVSVSVYPGFELDSDQREACKIMAARHNAALRFHSCNSFRESHSEIGTDDVDLVDRIYRTCAIVHEWRCHAVVNGYFFKCPESYFVPTVLGPRTDHRWEDGIRISDDPAFAVELRNYLAASVPLHSCGRCLGTAGRRFAHNQLREGWRTPQQRPAEELVDQRLLARAEQRHFVMSRLHALARRTKRVMGSSSDRVQSGNDGGLERNGYR